MDESVDTRYTCSSFDHLLFVVVMGVFVPVLWGKKTQSEKLLLFSDFRGIKLNNFGFWTVGQIKHQKRCQLGLWKIV